MSKKGLQILAKRGILICMKGFKISLHTCTHCLSRKKRIALFFYDVPYRKPNVLGLVHSIVCGPITTSTHEGERYFVTFINYPSMKVWVYGLKTKDHLFVVFRHFHASFELEIGMK